MSGITQRIINLVRPRSTLAGLDISETAAHFILIENGVVVKSGIDLDIGTIQDGRVANKELFVRALRELRSSIGRSKEKLPVIASLPANNIYTHAFTLPLLAEASIPEAAELNLKMLSPIGANGAYSDWQDLHALDESKLELLGAFAPKETVDEYLALLEAGGFAPMAVEFRGLALSRLIGAYGGLEPAVPHVVLAVASDGLDFLIIRDGNLYFDYFVPWSSVKSGLDKASQEMDSAAFSEMIVRETKKVSNFYVGRWGGQVKRLVLVTALYDQVAKAVQDAFPAIEILPLALQGLGDLAPSWYPACGSALRGLIGRSEDRLISLAPVGTEAQLANNDIKDFIKLWRNSIASVAVFLLAVFGGTDAFLHSVEAKLSAAMSVSAAAPESKETFRLLEQAKAFNAALEKALQARSKSADFLPDFQDITKISRDSGIVLSRIFADGTRSAVAISGKAASESATVAFKTKLVDSGTFKDVKLPLSSIVSNADGSVSFTLSLNL